MTYTQSMRLERNSDISLTLMGEGGRKFLAPRTRTALNVHGDPPWEELEAVPLSSVGLWAEVPALAPVPGAPGPGALMTNCSGGGAAGQESQSRRFPCG